MKGPDAEIYSAPMDHNYRALQNIDGNNTNGRSYGKPFAAPIVPAIDENAAPKIYAFVDDLFFLAKIQETARKLGIKVQFVKTDKEILEKVAESPEHNKPSLIIFDLNNASSKPLSMIPKLKTKLKKGTNFIGFLSHLQGELKAKAVEAGCDMVVPRSAFSQNLPQLLRRHGSPAEELEES